MHRARDEQEMSIDGRFRCQMRQANNRYNGLEAAKNNAVPFFQVLHTSTLSYFEPFSVALSQEQKAEHMQSQTTRAR
jgi:hypothetical protein